ncbi:MULTISPECIES: HU family DNA-binding protein [unclassified Paracoccus (in: a-proteobacteria)]|uniref:HU family DNA-binding protein n=1 Tax=unclassified Paracoccus (in: a-proteobacteria) TaxID=2688777 RepID=UPI0012B30FAA|nr:MULTISPECIES: HU family DNA-binding protein [unclassified Paracoccus (in: a-proteobacteria)]UXU74340.1 HU family DNA-binding protein [Paracoccus sp. SMMA_5]UXU80230.1 HU family DNA-binding protein [Paracoccus sp. SMMA_5_TC]
MTNLAKSELIAAVAKATGHSRKDVDDVVCAAVAVIREEALAGKTVCLPGFGRFSVKESPAREARNPRTGESIRVEARRTLRFRPSKSTA